jgi:PAS domain S-box-containing protein
MPKARRGGSGKRRGDESVEGGCAPSGRRTDERCGDDRRYRDLIAAAADWLWESDADGRIEFLSPDFEASTGIAPQSLLGMRLAELAAVDAESFEHHEQRASIAAEKPFRDIVFKLEPAGGSGTWIEIAGVPIVEAGGFQGYRGIGKTVTARVEARLALQRYRQFVDVASDWFWETDVDNRVGYVSPNIESVLGLPVSAYIGKRLADTDGIVIEPEAGRASLAAIKARQPYRGFVYCRKLPNGKIVWITSSGVPFSGTDGAFRGYRGVARDVTAQVEAEQKLRENEARFRRLFEINSDYYWESDTQHRLTFASPESAHDDIFGVPVAQLLGKRPSETLAVKFDSETGTRMLLAVKARQPYRHEAFSIKHANGTVRWVSVSSAPRFGPDGEYLGRQGTGVEITARREAEAAAQLAQRRLHDAVAYVTQPFVVFDAEDRAAAYNQAFADLFRTPTRNTPVHSGASIRELVDWQVQTGFHAGGPDEPPVDPETLVAHHQSEDENTYHLSDGRWMLVVHRRLPGGGRVGLWTDVTVIKRAETERRQLEEQLHHSQRLEALGTLAGGAAHEINNALMPVLALTKLVARKLPDGSRERRNLETVMNGAERARDLVKRILAFSRKQEEAQAIVDLGLVLQEALQLMRATMPTSITLAEEIAPTPAILGDPGQLHQVIVNLLANAVQAIGQSLGSILVGLHPEADGALLHLSIVDTGCGMDEATLTRVFEPFFTTKPVGEGTGLGLSMAHGIVKAHGGRIEVRSAPGRGSRFDIFLPTTAAGATRAA